MRQLVISVALLLTCAAAWGQKGSWSLSDCIDYALEHSITVRQSELNVEQREVDLNTAQMSRLPSVSAISAKMMYLTIFFIIVYLFIIHLSLHPPA